MYKRDRFNAGLVVERCAELVAIEARVQEIDSLLDGTAGIRRGGGGAICICGAPILLDARYCASCGRPLGGSAETRHAAPDGGGRPRVRGAASRSRPDRSTASSAVPTSCGSGDRRR